MWGVEFRGETSNALICATAEFEVRKRGRRGSLYRVRQGPHGMFIDQNRTGVWLSVKENATGDDVVAILPTAEDYGHDWTYSDFMIALTFYGEGRKRGYQAGTRDMEYEMEPEVNPYLLSGDELKRAEAHAR